MHSACWSAQRNTFKLHISISISRHSHPQRAHWIPSSFLHLMEENVITPTNKNLFIQTFSAVLHSVECQKAVNMLICDQWEVSAPNPSVKDCILLKVGFGHDVWILWVLRFFCKNKRNAQSWKRLTAFGAETVPADKCAAPGRKYGRINKMLWNSLLQNKLKMTIKWQPWHQACQKLLLHLETLFQVFFFL